MFSASSNLEKSLQTLGFDSVVKDYYKRFELLYKLRSEYVDRLHRDLFRALKIKKTLLNRKKPRKYSIIKEKDTTIELTKLIELRNTIVLNSSELYKRVDINKVIEVFDKYINLMLPLDKKIAANIDILAPIKSKMRTKVSTAIYPNGVEQIAELELDSQGNLAASEIFNTFIRTKRFLKSIDNYIDHNFLELQTAAVEAIKGKKRKYSRTKEGRFKSQTTAKKLKRQFSRKVSSLLNSIKPRTVELIGFDKFDNDLPEFFSVVELINSKLQAAVIANMGVNSLVNRTGRFASSTRLTKVTLTDTTAVIGYSYLERPYSVFEQGNGKAPWNNNPNSDPRSIIEKSLRQLAQEASLERFGVKLLFERHF